MTKSAFEGRVALITGAGSGIGRDTAVRLAEQGARVMVADINVVTGGETVALILGAGGEAAFVETDVAKGADVQSMVEATIDTYGRLDFAVNNAGFADPFTLLPEYSEESWRRTIDVMLGGVFLGMKYEIPKILHHGDGGAIVNTASAAGLVGISGMGGYTAAKHGVIGLTKSTAMEVARPGSGSTPSVRGPRGPV